MRPIPLIIKTECGKIYKLETDVKDLDYRLKDIKFYNEPKKWLIDLLVREDLIDYDNYIDSEGNIDLGDEEPMEEVELLPLPCNQYGFAAIDFSTKTMISLESDWMSFFFILMPGSTNFLNAIDEIQKLGEVSKSFKYSYDLVRNLWASDRLSYLPVDYKRLDKDFQKNDKWKTDWDLFVKLVKKHQGSMRFSIDNDFTYLKINREYPPEGGEVDEIRYFSKTCANIINELANLDIRLNKKEIILWEKSIKSDLDHELEYHEMNLSEYDKKYNNGISMEYRLSKLIK